MKNKFSFCIPLSSSVVVIKYGRSGSFKLCILPLLKGVVVPLISTSWELMGLIVSKIGFDSIGSNMNWSWSWVLRRLEFVLTILAVTVFELTRPWIKCLLWFGISSYSCSLSLIDFCKFYFNALLECCIALVWSWDILITSCVVVLVESRRACISFSACCWIWFCFRFSV